MRTCWAKKTAAVLACAMLLLIGALTAGNAAAFEPLAGDMSTFDPANQTFPQGDDVIKVGVFWAFTGPAAINGNIFWLQLGWAVHDINSQGGVMVGGKLKKIVLIKGDNQMKPTVAKRAMEKLCLEDNVDVIIGTTGSHLNLIGQSVAAKHKKIYLNVASLSDMLMDATNFNRYTFRACETDSMMATSLAQFYAKRPEKKFYILCQDYAYGHFFAESFSSAIKQVRPDAEIIGADFHPLFAKDFAPYLTKIKGAGAEVIVTGDYTPDADNMIKQMSQLGLNLPLAGPFVNNPLPLQSIPAPHGKGFVVVQSYMTQLDNPEQLRFATVWNQQWSRWTSPLYHSDIFKWPSGLQGQATMATYWLFKVIEKAGSLDADKIAAAWEGDEIVLLGNKLTMRACDHQAIFDMHVGEMIWPNRYFDNAAAAEQTVTIPSDKIAPAPPKGLKGCQ